MHLDTKKLLLNIRESASEDLLDRITAYRATLEPEAIELIETELASRGVQGRQIAAHAEICRQECLFDSDGTAKMCSFCRKPAVAEGWGWHRLWRRVPVLPLWRRYCKSHQTAG